MSDQSLILSRIQERALSSDSDAVYITQGQHILMDWVSEPHLSLIEIMSIAKSIVSLAIGILMDEGKIPSLDLLVCDIYPEWRQGQKKQITLRMLMDHTSGLQTIPEGNEITEAPDGIKLALAAELSNPPGTKFFYNNKAVNLLAGIVQQISGEPLDVYVARRIFGPLGIYDFGWNRDAMGQPRALGGVQMAAKDLHKIGQLVLSQGFWKEKRVISVLALQQLFTPSALSNNTCGLLWWVYQGPPLVYAGRGYLGQWLCIVPERQIIAVRQIRKGKKQLPEVDPFDDFKSLVSQL